MNVATFLIEQARIRPEAIAIVDALRRSSFLPSVPRRGNSPSFPAGPTPHSPLSFDGLDRASACVAAMLRREGLQSGDGVLVLHPMSAELYIVLTAIFRLGLVAMFVDPSAGRARLDACCAAYPPKALIASPKAHLLRLVSPALARIPLKFSTGVWVPGASRLSNAPTDANAALFDVEPVAEDAPALLTFTSGSTGAPKAAVRTHRFLLAQHAVLARCLDLRPGDVDLATLPIFALANLASGVTTVIPNADLRRPGAIDPAPIVEQMRALRVTSTAASPALLERLARHCRERGITLPDVEKVFAGGAPVFPRLTSGLAAVAPNARIVTVYGSTEAEPIAEISRSETSFQDVERTGRGAGLLAGRPVDAIELRVLRDRWGAPIEPLTEAAFSAACARDGEVGEIVVSGRHVLSGYLDGRGDEETKFRVAGVPWHRTGDLGYLDETGRLWLLGRCGASVTDAKGTLHPFAVEAAACRFGGVRRAALAAIGGRRVLAVEIERDGQTETLASLNRELAWAALDEILVCRTIPVDARHNAKVDYPALHRMLVGYRGGSNGGGEGVADRKAAASILNLSNSATTYILKANGVARVSRRRARDERPEGAADTVG
jgi:acyl-CoA synthetase (AMP-forming)/AMP-acid ligase II